MDASYVIMKFLDAQRIHNLTKFLQALHEKREANPDHTTLLLSCYTKLKDVNQLDKFIAADWEFSAEVRAVGHALLCRCVYLVAAQTAISVCRASGYLRQAEEIARKHKEHSWVLKILVEDFNDHPAVRLLPSSASLAEYLCTHRGVGTGVSDVAGARTNRAEPQVVRLGARVQETRASPRPAYERTRLSLSVTSVSFTQNIRTLPYSHALGVP